jgi:predicted transcriptional regulator
MATAKKSEEPKQESVKKPVKAAKKRGPHGPRKAKEFQPVAKIHIGKAIGQRMAAQGLSKNKLAKVLGVTPPSISLMVNSPSVQTERLVAVSETLKHNFFEEIARQINVGSSSAKTSEAQIDPQVTKLQGKLSDIEVEHRFLKEENAYLKRIIELLAGGSKAK